MIKRSGQKKRKIAEVILKFSHYVSKHNFDFCLEVLFVIHLISVLVVIVLNIQFSDVDCRERDRDSPQLIMVALDRGIQMESFRVGQKMTDVFLESGEVSLPCHKLILSLHSSYFKTLFQSTGFVESDQSHIALDHIKPPVLQSLVSFIYTGSIDILPETAVDILGKTWEV